MISDHRTPLREFRGPVPVWMRPRRSWRARVVAWAILGAMGLAGAQALLWGLRLAFAL